MSYLGLINIEAAAGAGGGGGGGSGDVVGPASATDDTLVLYDGTTGKLIKDGVARPTGTILGTTDTQTLTNKTITATTNDVAAKSLHSATTVVDVSAATAPTTGQVLTATSGTAATWQAAGGGAELTVTEKTASYTAVAGDDVVVDYGKATRSVEDNINASDAAINDFFGGAVSIYEDWAMIGAWQEDGAGTNRGAVYMYKLIAGTWTQKQKLVSALTANSDLFGISVSIHGNTCAIGVSGRSSNTGVVEVWTRNRDTWTLQQSLSASDATAGDSFGLAVGLNGNNLAIGAPAENSLGTNTGQAYVFTRTGTTWSEQQKFQSSDIAAGDYFASACRYPKGDTETILFAARFENSNDGAGYVFTRSGSTWSQQAKLVAASAVGATGQVLGSDITEDGNTVAIGAPFADVGGTNTGSVYIFNRTGTSWAEGQTLAASTPGDNFNFGIALAIEGDTLAIGCPLSNSTKGSVYLFNRTSGTWAQTEIITASTGVAGDRLGDDTNGVALHNGIIVANATTRTTNTGTVYLFSPAQITITLPASPSVGNKVRMSLKNAATQTPCLLDSGVTALPVDGYSSAEGVDYHQLWKNGDSVTFEYVGGSSGWTSIQRKIANRFVAKMALSTTQANVTKNVVTELAYDTSIYDYNGNLDVVTNNDYTVPITGLYNISCSNTWTAMVDGIRVYISFKDGTNIIYSGSTHSGSTQDLTIKGVCSVPLIAGASITTQCFQNSAVNTLDVSGDPTQTYCEITLISRL